MFPDYAEIYRSLAFYFILLFCVNCCVFVKRIISWYSCDKHSASASANNCKVARIYVKNAHSMHQRVD